MIGHARHGHGPDKVLVLPGLPGDHSNYDAVLPAVDPETFEWVIAEYRGTGLSREQAGRYTLAEIVADLDELTASLGWHEFHLLGHSFGGFVAQRLASLWRPRLKRMALLAPVLADGRPLDAATHELLRRACREDSVLDELADAVGAGRLPAAWGRWLADYARRNWRGDAAEGYYRAMADEVFAAELAGNDISCLILVGEHDAIYTPALMTDTLIRWLPNTHIEVLPACGHFSMLELPLLLAAQLERFFTAAP